MLTIRLYRDNLNGTGTPVAEAYKYRTAWTLVVYGEPPCVSTKSTIYFMLADGRVNGNWMTPVPAESREFVLNCGLNG